MGRTRSGSVTYLTLSQPLVEDHLAPLTRSLDECLAAGEVQIVFDLGEVPYCDSRGLEFLLDARDRVTGSGGHLKIANPNALMNEVLVATRLDRELEVHFDLEQATRSFL